ncbi:rhamnogalacturonan acetylesterase [Sphingomonas sanxanigenens]|uniref:SGNH hydrolase-type esterase domain-containing protein n=1 Tax=Sphingomonas sanxanigenens DSM 19645 = NX02 TaxID=1123269 RepID=W0AN57_9SPHN|nr:rhamnogalacturonan acetylesterase [Sphingomonas sanxanigenens]AHE57130.1 hypothetical protein NX02_27735 [Sphingomonas sanxanigenens DSM 19645 = NX02]
MIRAAAALAFAGLSGAALAAPGAQILIAGDSTASDYQADKFPQTGWGTMLRCALPPGMAVRSFAMGGRSTRTFIGEGRWDRLMAALQPGDTVLIQFGHNDANRAKPERYAAAYTSYRNNLLRFIADVRRAKGVPVLITPVARRSFDAAGKAKADFPDYSAVVRLVAKETGAAMIDLEARSRAWIDGKGGEAARAFYLHYPEGAQAAFPKGIADDTHFSELGARGVAHLVAGGLAGLDLPVSKRIDADAPALLRTEALGSTACR